MNWDLPSNLRRLLLDDFEDEDLIPPEDFEDLYWRQKEIEAMFLSDERRSI